MVGDEAHHRPVEADSRHQGGTVGQRQGQHVEPESDGPDKAGDERGRGHAEQTPGQADDSSERRLTAHMADAVGGPFLHEQSPEHDRSLAERSGGWRRARADRQAPH